MLILCKIYENQFGAVNAKPLPTRKEEKGKTSPHTKQLSTIKTKFS